MEKANILRGQACTWRLSNLPSGRRRFCAVQAFSPQAKTLAQGEFISPEHFKSKGGAALRAVKPKKKDICNADVFLFGAADGSRTRTPVRTQAPQACQSTNSSTAADKRFSKTALLLYCHRTGLSMVFPAESLTFSAAAGPAWPRAPGAARSTAAERSRCGWWG